MGVDGAVETAGVPAVDIEGATNEIDRPADDVGTVNEGTELPFIEFDGPASATLCVGSVIVAILYDHW